MSYHLKTGPMVYGIWNGLWYMEWPPYICPFVVPYCTFLSTRWCNLSNKLFTTEDYRVHNSERDFDSCFSIVGSKLWNSLPLGARSVNSIGAFRKLLKSHLFDLAFSPDQYLVGFLC